MPAWISPWGLVAGVFAIMSLLSASLIGVRLLTQALAAVGLITTIAGFVATNGKRTGQDKIWLILGGAASGLLLCLTLMAPAVLNNRWALDVAMSRANREKQSAVPRDLPKDPGKEIGKEDWVNAAEDAIRQNDLLLSVESVRAGALADKGPTEYAQVHLRFTNFGGRTITFEGFDQHRPTLQDAAGTSYILLEQRPRLRVGGLPVFDSPKWEEIPVGTAQAHSYLLVFDLPRAGIKNLKLEIPGQAWGRQGTFQFLINELFEADLPNIKN